MISVCMPTYNGARFIKAQVESILPQLNADDELVVSDDGSTDDTLAILQDFGDSRIKILKGKNRLGPVYNLERALKNASGDTIFLADQDDIWLPGKVEAVCEALKRDALVMHDAYVLKNGKRACTLSSLRPHCKGAFANWVRNTYTGCCMAFRSEVLSSALPFPPHLPMHDQWLGIVADKIYSTGYVETPLIEYRIHDNNATQLMGESKGLWKRIEWRFWLIVAIFKF